MIFVFWFSFVFLPASAWKRKGKPNELLGKENAIVFGGQASRGIFCATIVFRNILYTFLYHHRWFRRFAANGFRSA